MRATFRKTQLISQDRSIYIAYEGIEIVTLENGDCCIHALYPRGRSIPMGTYHSRELAESICNEIMNAVEEGRPRYLLP